MASHLSEYILFLILSLGNYCEWQVELNLSRRICFLIRKTEMKVFWGLFDKSWDWTSSFSIYLLVICNEIANNVMKFV